MFSSPSASLRLTLFLLVLFLPLPLHLFPHFSLCFGGSPSCFSFLLYNWIVLLFQLLTQCAFTEHIPGSVPDPPLRAHVPGLGKALNKGDDWNEGSGGDAYWSYRSTC